jgi:hypothetical protein
MRCLWAEKRDLSVEGSNPWGGGGRKATKTLNLAILLISKAVQIVFTMSEYFSEYFIKINAEIDKIWQFK